MKITLNRRYLPTSVAPGVKVSELAPDTSVKEAPSVDTCHAYVTVDVVIPSSSDTVAVS